MPSAGGWLAGLLRLLKLRPLPKGEAAAGAPLEGAVSPRPKPPKPAENIINQHLYLLNTVENLYITKTVDVTACRALILPLSVANARCGQGFLKKT